MIIRIVQDSPKWIRADLIRPRSKVNLYLRSVHPTVSIEDQFNDAEDSVRFNYPKLVNVPIERIIAVQGAQESI